VAGMALFLPYQIGFADFSVILTESDPCIATDRIIVESLPKLSLTKISVFLAGAIAYAIMAACCLSICGITMD
jgi:hypothetical protein